MLEGWSPLCNSHIRAEKRISNRGHADSTGCSILAVKNKAALARANITHVLSVLQIYQPDELFGFFQHLCIDVDDVPDENLLQHFPAAIRFIQSGLDAGGSVLVHW